MPVEPAVPVLRSTNARDEDFLWEMLFYASHSDEENGVEMDTISSNPDLTGYVTGWVEGGRLGVVAEWRSQRVGGGMAARPERRRPGQSSLCRRGDTRVGHRRSA